MDQLLTPIEMRVAKINNGRNWMWTADGPWGHAWGTAPSRDEALADAIDYLKNRDEEETI